MHDGYLFTLGVCGSASESSAATATLDAMLAALPPVKRAAYLGEILVSSGAPSLDDPLTAPLLADLADAEVLLIATPLPGGALPARLLALARALAAGPPAAPQRHAALVTFGAEGAAALQPLLGALARGGFALAGRLAADADADAGSVVTQAAALAQAAYGRARAGNPAALPQ